jgi:hypothetical protein
VSGARLVGMEGLLGARQHVTVQIAIADHAYEGPMRHDGQVADVRSNHQIGGVLDRARAIHYTNKGALIRILKEGVLRPHKTMPTDRCTLV